MDDIEYAVVFYLRFKINYGTSIEGTLNNFQEFERALIEPINSSKMLHNSNNVPGLQSKCVTIDLANTIGTAIYIFY
jgi:hypothetical protein